MRVVLEVISGHGCGKRTWLLPGQTIDVGRTEQASFVVAHDPAMAPVHFVLTCEAAACTLHDLNTGQGTWVNGQRVRETQLSDADRIEAGGTTMTVHIDGASQSAKPRQTAAHGETAVAADDAPAIHSVGSWHFHTIPPGWLAAAGDGLQSTGRTTLLRLCRVREQTMPGGVALGGFARSLTASIAAIGAEAIRQRELNLRGADESVETVLRFQRAKGSAIVQTQICAAKGRTLGFAIFITSDQDELRRQVDEMIDGLAFSPVDPPKPQAPYEPGAPHVSCC